MRELCYRVTRLFIIFSGLTTETMKGWKSWDSTSRPPKRMGMKNRDWKRQSRRPQVPTRLDLKKARRTRSPAGRWFTKLSLVCRGSRKSSRRDTIPNWPEDGPHYNNTMTSNNYNTYFIGIANVGGDIYFTVSKEETGGMIVTVINVYCHLMKVAVT